MKRLRRLQTVDRAGARVRRAGGVETPKRSRKIPIKVKGRLSPKGRAAALLLVKAVEEFTDEPLTRDEEPDTTFWSPAAWEENAKTTLTDDVVLVITHELGYFSMMFNPRADQPYELMEDAIDALEKKGYWAESATHWLTMVYA